MAEPSPEVLLESLVAHAPRYELGAALKLLFRCGFDWHAVRFEGVREVDGSRTSFVRQVRIEAGAKRLAIIGVDAGLLAPGSPLP